ncbi:MAG TPA: ATP-binding cassette domain-containing protein [Methylomirabilota bacterium]|nr:ATP-binding cassette domain-containing protein [Methylomirabilota bacterium]
MLLRAEGLVKTFLAPTGERVPVLAGVDLGVAAGEFVAVTGASGSGKSTLLNLLGLLEAADQGDVWYGEDRVSVWPRRAQGVARGRRVGFVFQSFLLLPSLTAFDNVLLAARYVGGVNEARRQRARELLATFGLTARIAHYPTQLSGGEQQRVAFCRAVLNDPPLLLADEPTGNLDDDNGAIILAALRARARAGGAVVVVTHRPDVARDATAVWALRAGRLHKGDSA